MFFMSLITSNKEFNTNTDCYCNDWKAIPLYAMQTLGNESNTFIRISNCPNQLLMH